MFIICDKLSLFDFLDVCAEKNQKPILTICSEDTTLQSELYHKSLFFDYGDVSCFYNNLYKIVAKYSAVNHVDINTKRIEIAQHFESFSVELVLEISGKVKNIKFKLVATKTSLNCQNNT